MYVVTFVHIVTSIVKLYFFFRFLFGFWVRNNRMMIGWTQASSHGGNCGIGRKSGYDVHYFLIRHLAMHPKVSCCIWNDNWTLRNKNGSWKTNMEIAPIHHIISYRIMSRSRSGSGPGPYPISYPISYPYHIHIESFWTISYDLPSLPISHHIIPYHMIDTIKWLMSYHIPYCHVISLFTAVRYMISYLKIGRA